MYDVLRCSKFCLQTEKILLCAPIVPQTGAVPEHRLSLFRCALHPELPYYSERLCRIQPTGDEHSLYSQSSYVFLTFATCFGMLMSLWTTIDIKAGKNMAESLTTMLYLRKY